MGHCIPVDPFYLSWKAKQSGFEARFIELAGQINSSMPEYVVNRITDALNDRQKSIKVSKIMILGVAYKQNIDDLRESPAIDVMALLLKKGALLSYHDPFVPDFVLGEKIFFSESIGDGSLGGYDCVVIVTDHSSLNYKQVVKESQLIVDTRNILKGFNEPPNVRL